MWITLPHYVNHQFHISTLIRELINRQTDYIIQGQQNTSYENHSKTLSLDYWICIYAEILTVSLVGERLQKGMYD